MLLLCSVFYSAFLTQAPISSPTIRTCTLASKRQVDWLFFGYLCRIAIKPTERGFYRWVLQYNKLPAIPSNTPPKCARQVFAGFAIQLAVYVATSSPCKIRHFVRTSKFCDWIDKQQILHVTSFCYVCYFFLLCMLQYHCDQTPLHYSDNVTYSKYFSQRNPLRGS